MPITLRVTSSSLPLNAVLVAMVTCKYFFQNKTQGNRVNDENSENHTFNTRASTLLAQYQTRGLGTAALWNSPNTVKPSFKNSNASVQNKKKFNKKKKKGQVTKKGQNLVQQCLNIWVFFKDTFTGFKHCSCKFDLSILSY